MCGITGIFNFSRTVGMVDQRVLSLMSSAIRHRGPDDSGIYCSEDKLIGMAFRRLSILDLSDSGHQPMHNKDRTIWITFNGEIYNHQELRDALEARGYKYHSHSDTESILYAYEMWGLECVHKFVGMFAIAIWDGRTETLHLLRDRLGIKPLYYTITNGSVVYGSEIKSILRHPIVSKDLNHQALFDYLSFYTTPTQQTIFSNVKKLPPATIMSIDTRGKVTHKRYWHLGDLSSLESMGPTPTERDLEYKEQLLCLLRDSIRLRMISDVPFGVLLSGGVDSSLNVALMSELMDRPVETFSAGFSDHQQFNELEYANKVSELYGTNHHTTLIDDRQTANELPNIAWHMDEPNADPACIPMYFVSELAHSSGTTVVQVGEGADELFAGYSHYLRELRYYRYFYNLPQPIKTAVHRLFSSLLPGSTLEQYAKRAAAREAPFFYGAIPSFNSTAKHGLLSSTFLANKKDSERIPRTFFGPSSSRSEYISDVIKYELKVRLPELLLMRVDKMAMASSVEARVPFLDHRIVEFALSLPDSQKIRGGEGKYILKRLAEDFLPTEIIYRPKRGLNSPTSLWLRSKYFSKYAEDVLLSSRLLSDESIFNRSNISELLKSHKSGKSDHSKQLWSLLILAMWHNQYFE